MKSTVHAGVLSLVLENLSFGAEIIRRFQDRYGGMLSSGPQHIYTALEQLERQGLVVRVRVEDVEHECFRATADGARAYREWQRTPLPRTLLPESARMRQMVLIRFVSTRPDDAESVRWLLDEYEGLLLAASTTRKAKPRNLMDKLAEDERRMMTDAAFRWIQTARDRLKVPTLPRET